jgi:hypothetical protein
MAHLKQPPDSLLGLVPDAPAAVTRAIVRAMAKQPTARYATAGAFANDLRVASARAADPSALATTLS